MLTPFVLPHMSKLSNKMTMNRSPTAMVCSLLVRGNDFLRVQIWAGFVLALVLYGARLSSHIGEETGLDVVPSRR